MTAPLTAREVEIHIDGPFSVIATVSSHDQGWLVHDIVLWNAESRTCSALPWEAFAFMTRDKSQSLESLVVDHCNGHASEWADDERLAQREMYAALREAS